ncbi:MAG: hypothetical protein FJW26_05460 [Acidimicrobiia bacterium]|nr:hypothetical protein [Acidimicrobiia bacterium]
MTNPIQKSYEETVARFQDWLMPNLPWENPLARLSCNAAMPLALYAHTMGNPRLAARVLQHIEAEFVRDGRLAQSPDRGNMLPYVPSWILMGSVLSGFTDLSALLQNDILRFQDPATGGFFGSEAARATASGAIDFDSTTQACAALSLSGELAAAERAGQFLKRLVECQPDLERRLLLVWASPGGLVSEFAVESASTFALEWSKPKQWLYKIGLLVRAFALLHRQTGLNQWLALAQQLYAKAVSDSPDLESNTLAHKMGWAACILFSLTRQKEYVEHACGVASHLASLQQADGAFHYPELWRDYSQLRAEQKINVGCQFATWIALARDVAAADPAARVE